jgi:glycine dehydrogenase subunit 1
MALQSSIYLASLGPSGLREVATVSAVMARELEAALNRVGLGTITTGKYLNEFVVKLPKPAEEIRAALSVEGVHGCVPVPLEYGFGNAGLFAATELTTSKDIAKLEQALLEVLD